MRNVSKVFQAQSNESMNLFSKMGAKSVTFLIKLKLLLPLFTVFFSNPERYPLEYYFLKSRCFVRKEHDIRDQNITRSFDSREFCHEFLRHSPYIPYILFRYWKRNRLLKFHSFDFLFL